MVWEGVPWAVDGGEHSAEVGRVLAYAATGGNEGVVAAGDCKVVASNIPDGNVHINSGGIVALNRFPGGGQQSYILRNVGDDVIALDPQGSGGGRYDLVAVIVEDPQYVGQPAPVSVPDGPYLRTVIYKDVDATVATLAEVDPDQTGLVLARVHFDASDGTITNADITDLRSLAMPKSESRQYVFRYEGAIVSLGTVDQVFPPGAEWDVPIPVWATHLSVLAITASMYGEDPTFVPGSPAAYTIWNSVEIDGIATAEGVTSNWSDAGSMPITCITADDLVLPDDYPGTTREMRNMLRKIDYGTGTLVRASEGSTAIIQITFLEKAL